MDYLNNTTYPGYQPPSSTAPNANDVSYSIPFNDAPGAAGAGGYGAPPQSTPLGAGASMGYRGVAQV